MDEKIFEQPREDSQEPSGEPGGAEDVEQQRAEIRESEVGHPDEHEPDSTGSRGDWTP